MTPNDTISISVAVDGRQKMVTIRRYRLCGVAEQDDAGKPVPGFARRRIGPFIPKGAQNVGAAKDFLRYLIKPTNLGGYLKVRQKGAGYR